MTEQYFVRKEIIEILNILKKRYRKSTTQEEREIITKIKEDFMLLFETYNKRFDKVRAEKLYDFL